MEEQQRPGEELFDRLNREKKQRRRKVVRTVIIVIAVIAVALVLLVLNLRRSVEQKFAAAEKEVLTYQVAPGTIHTLVTGSGVLAQVDEEEITVPAGVEIDEVFPEAGDLVTEGELIARVDMASVMSALSDTQSQLKTLDKSINSAKDDTASTTLTAGVSGRVKKIYAEVGDDVSSCMAKNGALALLSLDGYLAVDIEAEGPSRGDTVTVTRSDGSLIAGVVEEARKGSMTVLVTDDGPLFDEEVTVSDNDGKTLGTGKLYIHSPLAVTGYAGIVSGISTRENAKVTSGSSIVTLTDTKTSANYDALLRQREDLEETLMDLLTIYRDGAVLSKMDGLVSSVEYDEDTANSAVETQILTLYPQKQMSVAISVDETDILSLKEGQEAEIEVSSVSEDSFTGTVTEISKVADTSTGVTQYSAEVTLDREEGMLAGMTASVNVRIQGTENALIIPVDALHQNSASYYVYTAYDSETHRYDGRVEVTIGMQNDDYVEITSGLNEGDTVYYTESESFSIMDMFAMAGGMGGGMSSGSGNRGGGMPSGMPSGGGMPGGMGGNRGG
ncbi:MAG: HlyD family efflux transporter periplasmic adaptor subunit [Eubacteriales bacterium]|nr:HlyD family efflux transporter periplasmic adaptor subunit [Eubacteriales bacterium]